MMPREAWSPRCQQFLAALEVLRDRYEVSLTPSGYDTLQIWTRQLEDRGAFDWDGIEDRTDVLGRSASRPGDPEARRTP